MPYLCANIDRAIVMTQADLRGFWHPIGFRCDDVSPKSLVAITANLLCFAAGTGKENGPTDDSYIHYSEGGTFERRLAMCKRLAEDCKCVSQTEAIQLIVKEIVRKSEAMKAEVAAGTRPESAYLKPLEKGNWWGDLVLALSEAFDVSLEDVAA